MDAKERIEALGRLTQLANSDEDVKLTLALITSKEGRSIGEIARDDPELFELIYEQAEEVASVDVDGVPAGPGFQFGVTEGGFDE